MIKHGVVIEEALTARAIKPQFKPLPLVAMQLLDLFLQLMLRVL